MDTGFYTLQYAWASKRDILIDGADGKKLFAGPNSRMRDGQVLSLLFQEFQSVVFSIESLFRSHEHTDFSQNRQALDENLWFHYELCPSD